MKVLFRMLASILPGVVVGLGVIAYLEREALQEQWLLYSTGQAPTHNDTLSQAAPYREGPIPSRKLDIPEQFNPRPVPSPEPEPAVSLAPGAQKLEKPERQLPQRSAQPSVESANNNTQKTRPGTKISQPDLAEVIGLQQSKPKPADSVEDPSDSLPSEQFSQQQPEYPMVETDSAPQTPGVQVVEPAPDKQGLPIESEGELVDQVADSVAGLDESLASLGEPIGRLARQFDPRAGQRPMVTEEAEQSGEAIWGVGEQHAEEESQLQWLWNRGRQAFWEGNYEQAIESYRLLLEEDDMNPDAWGELGNIYYANKDWVRAVRAFGRAAVALIGAQRVEEAKKIIQVIRTIDPDLADQLEQETAG